MEGYGCFHKLNYICCEAKNVFHKLSIRFASKMDYEIDYDNYMRSLWKHVAVTITLNMFQMRLTIAFPEVYLKQSTLDEPYGKPLEG